MEIFGAEGGRVGAEIGERFFEADAWDVHSPEVAEGLGVCADDAEFPGGVDFQEVGGEIVGHSFIAVVGESENEGAFRC